MITRSLANTIFDSFRPGFISLIYGPRRVGKTVLLNQIAQKIDSRNILWLNADTQEAQEELSTTSQTRLANLVRNHDAIFIDEAQRVKNIGLTLKILIDNFPQKKIIATGSSSLMLARGVQEPLTGRTNKLRLYPLSTAELTQNLPAYQKTSLLETQLRFGGYPYLTNLAAAAEKKRYLQSIIADYLFRDVLLLKDVSSPETLKKLAILLAFQIGSEVSLNELANNLGIDIKTVRRYLSLLKQSFVIFELGAFSRNLRKEVAKSKKYYFWDLGIRNALTDQFLPLDTRSDLGQLWENFLAIERLKKHEYSQTLAQYYFWRTYEKAEIDWIELQEDQIAAFEFKWKPQKSRTPKAFRQAYGKQLKLITPDNYLGFV